MNCRQCSEQMMDVLYGEEVEPRTAFDFFRHLVDCPDCESEYLELIETREMLGQWDEPSMERVVDSTRFQTAPPKKKFPWLPPAQKIAAGVLMLFGLLAMLQYAGIIPQSNRQALVVSDEELAQMIHDVLVAKQVEDWKVIGTALLNLKEEIEMQNRLGLENVYKDINFLQQRYVLALEENNRNVQKLLTQ